MKLNIGSTIKITNLTAQQEAFIMKGLRLLNPAYAVMKRQGNMKALYAIPEYIKYYKKILGGLEVGRGVLPRLLKHFPECINNTTTNFSEEILSDEFKTDLKLRDYQEGVSDECLKHFNGIIRIDTGWGKSVLAIKMIEESQLRTLIVVPRIGLLKQFRDDIKKFSGYDCGIINGKTFNVKPITIATVQTLKLRDLSSLEHYFGMCLFDECHTYISDKGMKVIQSFAPLRLYGMTATDDRSDGQGEAIKFMFGNVIVDRKLPFSLPFVEIVKNNNPIIKLSIDGKTPACDTYASIIDSQVEDMERNKLIVFKALDNYSEKRKILILTKRTKHYDYLHDLIPENISCFKIKSSLNVADQKVQDELLHSLREGSGEFDIIMGTFGLLSTGINIPALDTIIFAGDIKSSVLATQSIGRILRLFEGKQQPKIIDIDDVKSGILHNQARLRKNFYLSNEWEII